MHAFESRDLCVQVGAVLGTVAFVILMCTIVRLVYFRRPDTGDSQQKGPVDLAADPHGSSALPSDMYSHAYDESSDMPKAKMGAADGTSFANPYVYSH